MLKVSLLSLVCVGLMAMSGAEVAKKSEESISGYKDAKSEMYMTLINATGQRSERKRKAIVLEKDGGDKSLMEFLSPADVKGTKFLNYQHILKDDDQWLYMPALKRVKRIASKNKSGSFMGSEFSYEDLSSFVADKYTYEEKAEEVQLNGKKTYKIVLYPVSKNSGYTKELSWVDADTFLIQKVEYYDRKSELLKTAYFEKYKKVSGVWRNETIVMKNIQNDKETILVWKNETIKNGLKERNFHKRVLKK